VVRKIDTANGDHSQTWPIAQSRHAAHDHGVRVQAPELLSGIKVGDPVAFHAESFNGCLP